MTAKRKNRGEARQISGAGKLRAVSGSEPGSPFSVLWHPEAERERDASWPVGEVVAIEHAVEKLRALGPQLRHPHSSAIKGSSGKGLRELRPRGGRSRWRPLYRQVKPDTFVILAVGPEAQINAAAFNTAVESAQRRFEDLEID